MKFEKKYTQLHKIKIPDAEHNHFAAKPIDVNITPSF